jgi:hypothetical protein
MGRKAEVSLYRLSSVEGTGSVSSHERRMGPQAAHVRIVLSGTTKSYLGGRPMRRSKSA